MSCDHIHVDLNVLEACIGYSFSERRFLKRALTHRSADQARYGKHMERLEFLGDAVLGLVISEFLHDTYPDKPEGELSRMRSVLVRKDALLKVAQAWHLVDYLCVGDSERIGKDGSGIKSPSITANAVEAVIGAVFEDGGWEPARHMVKCAWQAMLVDIGNIDTCDAKSRLQEWTQANDQGLPEYELKDMGAGSTLRFEAICRVKGQILGRGHGDRKKQAETKAAEHAYRKLGPES
ncbi:MAG: ribonuclease III [Mariprofundus sp.]|nr:ribonuclease III [Mariprofundus sp.]